MLLTIHIILILGVLWLTSRDLKREIKWLFLTSLSWRVLLGLLFGYVYVIHLQYGDTIHFYNEATALVDLAFTSPSDYLDYLFSAQFPHYKSEARNVFFTKVLSLFLLPTGKNYWIATIYFSLISFAASWTFFRKIRSQLPQHLYAAAFGFLFFPGPIFWTAGILKDSLVLVALFFVCSFCLGLFIKERPTAKVILITLLSLYVLWQLRYFMFALSLIGLFTATVYTYLIANIRSRKIKWITFSAGLIIIASIASSMAANLNFDRFPLAIYDNYNAMVEISQEGKFHSFDLNPNWISILQNLPEALWVGLFSPLFGSASFIYFPFGWENLLILTLSMISCLLYFKKQPRLDARGFVLIGFILICAAIFPLASPNYGTLVRYKAIYLPFYIYLLSIPVSTALLENRRKN